MHLNPFIRAFFRSTVPAQCNPVQDHILLVPTTDILLNSRDRESGTPYSTLAGLDEFLGSHVLRLSKTDANAAGPSSIAGSRERRSKAKQFSTFNGRTVIIKDAWVYSHAGFKTLVQAQLLNDAIFYPDSNEPQQWLIYFISRPLVGSLEHIPIGPKLRKEPTQNAPTSATTAYQTHRKLHIHTFDILLGHFPVIARQLRPGLEKMFLDFGIYHKPLPESPPSEGEGSSMAKSPGTSSSVTSSRDSSNASLLREHSEDEDVLRSSLEKAIMTAIELFQRVDQSQLHLLATTTELTGSSIEHLIERYVTEQLHDVYLFPRLLALKKTEDQLLQRKIKEMQYIDISQVGIPYTDHKSKATIVKRIQAGILKFEQLVEAKSPGAMMDILLETAQALTNVSPAENPPTDPTSPTITSEKPTYEDNSTNPVLTMNADMLVSLMLVVVIRSRVRGLQACLAYMRNFLFMEDVEQGERGYALSTLEAVAFHITLDSDHMGRASFRNRRLWERIKTGNLEGVRSILEKDNVDAVEAEEEEESDADILDFEDEQPGNPGLEDWVHKVINANSPDMGLPELADSDSEEEAPLLTEEDIPPPPEPDSVVKVPQDTPQEIVSELEVQQSFGGPLESDEVSREVEVEATPVIATESTSPSLILAPSSGETSSTIFRDDTKHVQPKVDEGNDELEADPLLAVETVATPSITINSSTVLDAAANEGTNEVPVPPVKDEDISAKIEAIMPSKRMSRASFNPEISYEDHKPPTRVRLSRSQSMRSETSRRSWASSLQSSARFSRTSVNEDLTSVEILSKTRNAHGDSIVMMAVIERQKEVLEYLIDESAYFPLVWLLQDENNEGTTLLSAAVHGQSAGIIDMLLREIIKTSRAQIKAYLARSDKRGRTVGHYLFNKPDLIQKIGSMIPWTHRDTNGQTPLFACCRSYDHPQYTQMVQAAIEAAEKAQTDGERLHLDDHVDVKGNTLLHIVHEQPILKSLLSRDAEVNAVNEKGLTALMLASKYGRIDTVRTLFADKRVDILAKEARGLMAVELAKDDEVRNKFDDLVMFTYPAEDDGRITAVVRGIFVEDATVRLVVKSGALTGDQKYTITTCRRALADFEFLAYWLSYEHPASWLPVLNVSRSPFQIPSKPSRAILRDIQLQLDKFLRALLSHSTFSTHELLWEFFLVPELQPQTMIERSSRKCEIRNEMVQEDYEPVEDTKDVEIFMSHAKESVRAISYATRTLLRRLVAVRRSTVDLVEAHYQVNKHLASVPSFGTSDHMKSLQKFTSVISPNESSPFVQFTDEFRGIQSTLQGVMTALDRPRRIITEMNILQKDVDKHLVSLRRSDRWPLGFMDDTRQKIHQDAADQARGATAKQTALSRELRYSQSVAAAELASFNESHARRVKEAIRRLARGQIAVERERLEAMKRAMRGVISVPLSAISPTTRA